MEAVGGELGEFGGAFSSPDALQGPVEAVCGGFVDRVASVTGGRVPSCVLGRRGMAPWVDGGGVGRLQRGDGELAVLAVSLPLKTH